MGSGGGLVGGVSSPATTDPVGSATPTVFVYSRFSSGALPARIVEAGLVKN